MDGDRRTTGFVCPLARASMAHARSHPRPIDRCPRGLLAHLLRGCARRHDVCWLIANHLHLTSFESAPEVRAFCSAVIARPQRSYDPRLPPWPPPVATLRPPPSQTTGLPRLPEPPSRRAVPLPRRIKRVHVSIASPLLQPSPNGRRVGIRIGAFEACSGLTHVTAHRIARRPRRPLSRGFSPSGHPAEPLVSYQINRQFSGWILPPQVIRAFGAHCQQRTYDTGGADLRLAVASCASTTVTSCSAISRVAACALPWSCTPREACRRSRLAPEFRCRGLTFERRLETLRGAR